MLVTDFNSKYDRLLLHGTSKTGGAGGNKCIDLKANIPERMSKALSTQTSICCSSWGETEDGKHIFAPSGLFLSNGEIIAADSFDLGSRIMEDCNRECDNKGQSIDEQVEDAWFCQSN